jgi:signal transduction histidine kinase
MNAILGFTELLRKQQLDSTSSQYVKAIETSGEHLLSLVNDVLDFSKMEAGMLNIQSQPFSVRELMESLKNMLGEKAKEQNIRFSVQLNKSIPDRIIGDAFRLKQILLNLAGNALKFTAEGRVVISANIAESDDDSIKILFTVKDTGIGIPQQKLKYVFERFNQVDEEASRRFGGTGLGLSIVKQLVELQHGSIEINSELNQGTEVRFTIPYRKENWQNYSVAESKTTSAALSKFSQLKYSRC